MRITIGKAKGGLGSLLPGQADVGWPSALGNPFVMGRDGSREEVIGQVPALALGTAAGAGLSSGARAAAAVGAHAGGGAGAALLVPSVALPCVGGAGGGALVGGGGGCSRGDAQIA